jgi:ferrochelatase
MRYWNPLTDEAVSSIDADRISHLVVLPLYPQFSVSTTGSSLNRMNELFVERGHKPPRISIVESWQTDAAYIDSLAAAISEELSRFQDPDPSATHLVFSAHSVPVSYIENGDPYLAHTQETVDAVMQKLGADRPHSLSFQSKVGPVKWLEPSTDQMIRKLAQEGASQVLLVPVSFVSEHIETLYELDILYRGVAEEVGIRHYRRVGALNCRPDFISALAGLVARRLQ